MASTAEPPTEPRTEREEPPGEMSPLLGANFARQGDGEKIIRNFGNGSAWITQIGVIALILLVVVPVFENPILLVSGHPLSQIVGIFAIVQSILVLQPTHLDKQKIQGQRWHALIHVISFLSFVAGITVIEYNKEYNGLEHFHSAHAYIGVITCGVLVLQYLVGITMWAVPVLYGGVDNAKSVWKYHRWSGYLLLLLLLASVISATRTDYVQGVLKIKTLFVVIASVGILIGIIPQVSLKKLGLKRDDWTSWGRGRISMTP